MKCYECGTNLIVHENETLRCHEKGIGEFNLADASWDECPQCNERFLHGDTVLAMEAKSDSVVSQKLGDIPLDHFVFMKDVGAILGISLTAVQKSKRIIKLVYQKIHCDKRMYLKESVEAFRDSKDGRIDLDDFIKCNCKKTQPGHKWFARHTKPVNQCSVSGWHEHTDNVDLTGIMTKPTKKKAQRRKEKPETQEFRIAA